VACYRDVLFVEVSSTICASSHLILLKVLAMASQIVRNWRIHKGARWHRIEETISVDIDQFMIVCVEQKTYGLAVLSPFTYLFVLSIMKVALRVAWPTYVVTRF
jgi:hypothetical protein